MKRICSFLLVLAVVLSLGAAAFAVNYSDVPDGAWYADAVAYVQDNGLMSGTDDTHFDPNGTMTRAMLAAVLHRAADRPVVNYLLRFDDVADGAWYTEAVRWAVSENIMSGYDSAQFGANDPVSREQIAAILWRYAGGPTAEAGTDFTDESDIAPYAAAAVDWARANHIINGMDDGRFDPKGNATRAQVASILRGYLTMNDTGKPATPPVSGGNSGTDNGTTNPPSQPSTPTNPDPSGGKVLVVYFSATGSTERVAGYIADTLNADTFEITPVNPYTSADLNYGNASSRVSREHNDPSLQDIELTKTTPDNWDDYDTVFIGYPIWWHAAAWPVNHFVTDNDFTGKTVIPFCTSASSPLEGSDEKLAAMTDTGNWLPGQRFSSGASETAVAEWVNSLNL